MRSSTSRSAVVLSARDVRVGFGGVEVLAGVDLDLHRGEWLGLIGPNGSGKSTFLRSLVGMVASTGRVHLGDGTAPGPRDVSLMPQAPELPPGMTVVEYVLLGRTAHLGWLERESAADRRIAVDALRRLGMGGFADRTLRGLSGGETQRVVIARALTQQAPVLLLDEPTSALDPGHQVEVLELVDDLRHRDGLTVVAAMHDLGIASRYADRLLLLEGGRRIALGTPREVLQDALLSQVYGWPLHVHDLDGHLVVVPAPRAPRHTDAVPDHSAAPAPSWGVPTDHRPVPDRAQEVS
ncbi:ABC transporter ATP-binding protein [Ornithinimicrobium cavernae]|uniref:ABC transporter ATP-binding protein n=1 Tax=Ornithinimicrobium cavernae TaxID=2666047 RepID=UPI000D699041|nr:ABC transporter ATP-binding protein [Ornithinimicrobium cavernae]